MNEVVGFEKGVVSSQLEKVKKGFQKKIEEHEKELMGTLLSLLS